MSGFVRGDMPTEHARLLWLGLAASPYFTLALADAWMHERARRVPLAEQLLHAGLFASLAAFFAGAFLDRDLPALAGIGAYAVLYSADEFGFHRGIARAERVVHALATVALLGFVVAWQLLAR